MLDKRKMGKRSRAQGKAFELRVRKDLEEKGWIVSKWNNNVEFPIKIGIVKHMKDANEYPAMKQMGGKCIPAKAKFNPFTKMLMMGSGGFPDFIAFKNFKKERRDGNNIEDFKNKYNDYLMTYEVVGVESKINGTLDKEERAKCEWLLKNNIFSRIFIAQKIKVGRKVEIEYKEFK